MKENTIHLVNFYPEERLKQYPTALSLGPARLGARLLSLGQRPKLFSFPSANQKYADTLLRETPDILGFSIHYWDKQLALALLSLVREAGFHGDILFGGPEAKNLQAGKDFDYEDNIFVFPSEGEIPIEAYLNRRYRHSSPKIIQDLILAESANIRRNKMPQAVPLFSPEFDAILSRESQYISQFTWYDTLRGCPYGCGYCDHGRGRRIPTEYEPQVLLQEIQNIGQKFREVFVIDPILGGGNRKKVKERLALFAQYATNSFLTFYLRPETIDDELIKQIQNSHIRHIIIGLQTMNSAVPHWLRQNNPQAVEKLTELTTVAPVTLELIIGLPGDTFKGLQDTLKYVAEKIRPEHIAAYPLTVLDGTPLREILIAESDTPTNSIWITRDQKYKAVASYSYSSSELQRMISYARQFVADYNSQSV